jgi:hypothetical protein
VVRPDKATQTRLRTTFDLDQRTPRRIVGSHSTAAESPAKRKTDAPRKSVNDPG